MVEFILYVADQRRSRDFYCKILDKEPVLDVNGMTEFILSESCKLGIMPAAGIKKILGSKITDPEKGNGIPRCEIYLYKENIEECIIKAINAGAKELSHLQLREWGDVVAYFSDPDGHIIAFASVSGAK